MATLMNPHIAQPHGSPTTHPLTHRDGCAEPNNEWQKITILRLSSINYSTTWSSSAAAAAGSKIPKLDNR